MTETDWGYKSAVSPIDRARSEAQAPITLVFRLAFFPWGDKAEKLAQPSTLSSGRDRTDVVIYIRRLEKMAAN